MLDTLFRDEHTLWWISTSNLSLALSLGVCASQVKHLELVRVSFPELIHRQFKWFHLLDAHLFNESWPFNRSFEYFATVWRLSL